MEVEKGTAGKDVGEKAARRDLWSILTRMCRRTVQLSREWRELDSPLARAERHVGRWDVTALPQRLGNVPRTRERRPGRRDGPLDRRINSPPKIPRIRPARGHRG